MYEPLVIVQPTKEPVTLNEVWAQCRIDTADEDQDALIANIFIPSARDYIEWRTGRTFFDKTLEWVLDIFPLCGEIVLPYATPLTAIESIKYKDQDGNVFTWASSNYVADTDSKIGRVVPAWGQWWPSYAPYPINSVRIRGQAGTDETIGVLPAKVKYAMLLLVAKMWEYREAVVISDRMSVAQLSIDYGVESFITQLQASFEF